MDERNSNTAEISISLHLTQEETTLSKLVFSKLHIFNMYKKVVQSLEDSEISQREALKGFLLIKAP